jgi:peptide-methionine (S)-S-oxide reductase
MSDREEPAVREVAVLAGGCFWCLEAVYDELDGVESVQSGYMGGHVANPTYEEVCSELTGHAEAVRITFDPARIRYEDLLEIFFDIHDPTTLNRQGPADIGTQYRSAIFYLTPQQRAAAETMIAALTEQGAFPDPIVTEVTEAGPFYPAEPYHDDYYRRNPNQGYCRVVIAPKVAKFRRHFGDRLKPSVAAQVEG